LHILYTFLFFFALSVVYLYLSHFPRFTLFLLYILSSEFLKHISRDFRPPGGVGAKGVFFSIKKIAAVSSARRGARRLPGVAEVPLL
jgi:hypothetical protein